MTYKYNKYRYPVFQVLVLIIDINDNAPRFPPGGYTVKISEGAKANSDVIAAVAKDPDAGSNGQLIYELISGNTGGKCCILYNAGIGEVTVSQQIRLWQCIS